jgi:hypothetical protein
VDFVTAADHGAGVRELIETLVASDLAELEPRLTRHELSIGYTDSGTEVRVKPYDGALLVAGRSGAGKTSVTTAILERLCEAQYQFCVFDPEGDYHEFPAAIALRGGDARALADEALQVLARPSENAVVSLLDLRLEDRPPFLQLLLPRLIELRASSGRPHWIVIDEAHHMLPADWQPSTAVVPSILTNLLFVTVHPDHVARPALDLVEALIAVGPHPQTTVDAFFGARGDLPPQLPEDAAPDGENAWLVRPGVPPVRFRRMKPSVERRRHRQKYAEGELGVDRSFYFRGPEGRLNLRAQNLQLFAQLADGVDDETWLHHLRRHDVSHWFRHAVKDDALADEAAVVEAREDLSPADSRALIRAAIERRYTAPA